MVAYTDPDCLPYFQGSDSPCVNTGTLCEPSTVDCDFAAAVEVRLDQIDEVVGIVEDPPMAWIETLVPMTVSADTLNDEPVIFTTVRVDTANMVNLDANPSAIVIPRTGLYTVFIYCRAQTNTVGGADFIDLVVSTSVTPVQANNIFADTTPVVDQAINLDNILIAPGIQMPTYYEQGQTVTMLLNANGAAGGVVNTTKMSFGIAWLGDLA